MVAREVTGVLRPADAAGLAEARLVVGTEAALHRVPRADLVAFLDIDQHLLAARFGAGEETLSLLARAARLVGYRGTAGAGCWSRPASPDTRCSRRRCTPTRPCWPRPEREIRRSTRAPPLRRPGPARGAPGSPAYAEGLASTAGLSVVRRTRNDGWCGRRTTRPCATDWPPCPGPPIACGWRSTRPTPETGAAGPVGPVHWVAMSTYSVRVYGDPVLKQVARAVDEVDGSLVRLVEDMVETMYDSEGAGLAAPQVGVQKRLFVYDVGEGPEAVVNPTIVESDGEWYHDEGCLSIPGLRLGIVRPDRVHLRGRTSTARRSPSRPTSSWRGCSSTRSTTSTGYSWSSGWTTTMRKQALRVLRDRALGLDTSAMEAKLVSAGSELEV